jgi:hypothetical protein
MAHRPLQTTATLVPTAEEIASRKAVRGHITDIDAQILALETSLVTLRKKRNALKKRLHRYTYPVLTLPTDITSHIFTHFLPPYPRCPAIAGMLSPTTLGHVCHSWREIALSTPTLWRAIAVYVYPDTIKRYLPILESWLKLSRNCALSIRLQYNSYNDPEADPTPLLQAIIPHCTRWQYLKTNVPMHHLGSGSTPLLKALSVRLVSGASGWIGPSMQAPQLQKLTLELYRDIFAPIVPWAQLTTLDMSITPPQFLRIIPNAINVVHCRLFIVASENAEVAPDLTRHVELPLLECFVCKWTGTDSTPQGWFGALTLTALRRLQISDRFFEGDPIPDILSFISRSRCSLQELYIDTEPDAAKYRAAFPSIPLITFARGVNIGNGYFAPDSSDFVYETETEDGSAVSNQEVTRDSSSDEESGED